jgi:hypothetical protein
MAIKALVHGGKVYHLPMLNATTILMGNDKVYYNY